jgi:hypothetical protein
LWHQIARGRVKYVRQLKEQKRKRRMKEAKFNKAIIKWHQFTSSVKSQFLALHMGNNFLKNSFRAQSEEEFIQNQREKNDLLRQEEDDIIFFPTKEGIE